jgi:molybdopterin synthase sulfur carrier subunit
MITVRFFATLRELFGAKQQVVGVAEAPDVAHLLDVICDSPARRDGLLQASGRPRKDIVFLVNGRNIAFLAGLDTLLAEGDAIDVFPPVFGG